MTTLNLDDIRALCEAAFAGPWRAVDSSDGKILVLDPDDWRVADVPVHDERWLRRSRPNAAFIAASRTLVPQMLAEIERLRDELARIRPVYEAVRHLQFLDARSVSVVLDAFNTAESQSSAERREQDGER